MAQVKNNTPQLHISFKKQESNIYKELRKVSHNLGMSEHALAKVAILYYLSECDKKKSYEVAISKDFLDKKTQQ